MFDARHYPLGDNWVVGDLVAVLQRAGVGPGDLAGLAIAADGTSTVATADGVRGVDVAEIARADQEIRPRWVTWSQETAGRLVARDVRLSTCWDVAAVHRLLFGGWRADPAYALARLHGTPP